MELAAHEPQVVDRCPPPSTRTGACTWPSSTATRASRGPARPARAGFGCWRTGTETATTKRPRSSPTSWSGPPAWRSGQSRRRRTSSTSRTRTATAGPTSGSRSIPGGVTNEQQMLNNIMLGRRPQDLRLHRRQRRLHSSGRPARGRARLRLQPGLPLQSGEPRNGAHQPDLSVRVHFDAKAERPISSSIDDAGERDSHLLYLALF